MDKTEWLCVKNWMRFQHYKHRNPPWIKLHRSLLDDYEFSCLQDASKAHLMLIWVFASGHDGKVPNDPAYIQNRLGLSELPDVQILIDKGFLLSASTTLAPCMQNADSEKSRVETEKSQRRGETALSVNESKKRSAVDLARSLARKQTSYPH